MNFRETFIDLFTKNGIELKHSVEIPGPKSVPYSDLNLTKLRTDYMVAMKTDGVRSLMYITKHAIYLIKRNWDMTKVADEHPYLYPTILDGESVQYFDNDLQKEVSGYVAFDMLLYNGEDVGKIPNYVERLELLKTLVFSGTDQKSASSSFFICTKHCVPTRDIRKMPKDTSGIPYDGYVFTPTNKSYYDHDIIKYKPPENLTIDFELRGSQDNRLFLKGQRYGSSTMIRDKDAKTKLLGVRYPAVVECRFDRKEGQWRLVKVRTDKPCPNSVTTATQVYENMLMGYSEEKFLDIITQ